MLSRVSVFSPAERHMDMLPEIPEIYFNNEELEYSNEFACREGLKNWNSCREQFIGVPLTSRH